MKAGRLETVGTPVKSADRDDPVAVADGAVVSVLAVRVSCYTRHVFDGTLGYCLPTPLIPGPACIGRVFQAGAIDLSCLEPQGFPLHRIEDAMDAASRLSGLQFAHLQRGI